MKKILIETNSNIGDAVMNVPIINFLKAKFPNISIDLICDARSAAIFSEFWFVSNIYIKDKKNRFEFFELLLKLSFTRYDLAIGLRSDAVPLLINARKKLYKHDKDPTICGKVSETLCNYSILKKLFADATEDKINTKISIHDESAEYIMSFIKYKFNDKILVVAPGANSPAKIWPSENFVELVNKIKHKFDKVVIVGSANEVEVCKKIANECGAIDMSGKTNLTQIAGLFLLSSQFIGNDSGLGHIAAAQKCNTFIIFAHNDISYADPVRYTPYGQSSIYRKTNNEPPISVDKVLAKLVIL